MSSRERIFVVTFGRSGSSLLCAILADAGADFGVPVPAQWDPRHGALEHRDIKRAAHHMRRAFDLDHGRRFRFSPELEARWRRRRARHWLARALPQADAFKIGDLDLLVQMSFALGYAPRVVLNYRDFEQALASTLVGRKHVGPDALAAEYARVCRQGLALVRTFGGCVVGYEDMLGDPAGAWLDALAASTGLAAESLRAAAARRITATEAAPAATGMLYPECRRLYDLLAAQAGRAFPPSRTVLRALDARRA
ncbi:MAG: hypothetical protein RLW61_05675 [Gammaproteobacteria bacterium]